MNERFVKPFDRELFVELLDGVAYAITVEDHDLQGGFGSAFLEMMAEQEISAVQGKCPGIPDGFVPHGTQTERARSCGFDNHVIAQTALRMVRREKRDRKGNKKEGWERGSA